jgi:hypothetical protein
MKRCAVFWLENLKGRDHSEDLGVDGKIMTEGILGWESMGWIYLAHERDQWCAILKTVINLRVP